MKKTDALIKNGNCPTKPGHLPRGVSSAGQWQADAIASGRKTEAQLAAKRPVITCEKSCGYQFKVTLAMLLTCDKGLTVRWTCPKCANVNNLKNRARAAKHRAQLRNAA